MILWSEYTSNISYYVSGHSQPILNRIKIQSDFAKLVRKKHNDVQNEKNAVYREELQEKKNML